MGSRPAESCRILRRALSSRDQSGEAGNCRRALSGRRAHGTVGCNLRQSLSHRVRPVAPGQADDTQLESRLRLRLTLVPDGAAAPSRRDERAYQSRPRSGGRNLLAGQSTARPSGGFQPDQQRSGRTGATVEQEMAEISPWVKLLNTFGLRTETTIINFNMIKARDCAWNEACSLAAISPDSLPAAIAAVDLRVGAFGGLVASPPFLVKLQLLPIRLRELNGVRRVLDVLAADKAVRAAHV